MLSYRTKLSLSQYLALQDQDFIATLLMKHGLNGYSIQFTTRVLSDTVAAVEAGSEDQLAGLLEEISRTSRDLRTRVDSKHGYDERFEDLCRCLQLDGYRLDSGGLVPVDLLSVVGVPPLEDDLKKELNASKLPGVQLVIQKLDDSASAFLASKPNYNACLNDARVALQTLATQIAQVWVATHPGSFDATKWGSVIEYLRTSGLITSEEERGLIGVFGFVSPGSHRPLGLSDEELARLGRSFVAGMCWFLIKRYRSSV